jgi:hypothetical protein
VAGHDQVAGVAQHERIVRESLRVDRPQDAGDAAADRVARSHVDPFVREGRARASPPVVLAADQAVLGNEDVIEEHLVEHRLAGELAQRTDLDAG